MDWVGKKKEGRKTVVTQGPEKEHLQGDVRIVPVEVVNAILIYAVAISSVLTGLYIVTLEVIRCVR